MLLVIDNYDSFTYNLVQYLGELGAEPLVRRNDAIAPAEIPKPAEIAETAGADILLVGDSLGVTVLGYENTHRVTLDEMRHHLRAARPARPFFAPRGDGPRARTTTRPPATAGTTKSNSRNAFS